MIFRKGGPFLLAAPGPVLALGGPACHHITFDSPEDVENVLRDSFFVMMQGCLQGSA